MILETFTAGPFETNAYVVACPHTRQAAIVDPAPGSYQRIHDYIAAHQLQPVAILLTHTHWDHIADAKKVKDAYRIPIYVHPNDAPNLESPGQDGIPCWIPFEGVVPTHLVEEGSSVDIGSLHFEVIHTPGHSPGGVCYYCPEDHVLLSGDTLFHGTIGNLSLPTSEPKNMWPSLRKLAKLPPETRVYPGHGPSTTIKSESWLPRAEEVFGM